MNNGRTGRRRRPVPVPAILVAAAGLVFILLSLGDRTSVEGTVVERDGDTCVIAYTDSSGTRHTVKDGGGFGRTRNSCYDEVGDNVTVYLDSGDPTDADALPPGYYRGLGVIAIVIAIAMVLLPLAHRRFLRSRGFSTDT